MRSQSFRLSDLERATLLEHLSDVLSAEERDNFRAALERRPIIKASGGAVAGVQASVSVR